MLTTKEANLLRKAIYLAYGRTDSYSEDDMYLALEVLNREEYLEVQSTSGAALE